MNNQKGNLTNTSPILLPQEQNGVPVQAPEAKKVAVSYCLYARKSTEDDERQALSIDSQIKEMAQQAQNEGDLVVDIRRESHSAKESSQRPVFNTLIENIRRGLFNGILSWAPDRLSRNAGDLGTLVDLMDSGYLKEIRTHGQIFTNSPNDKFLLMILCSQAKLENDNRGINVRRGQRTKCEMGIRPSFAPLGYLNDLYSGKGMKKVFVDKKRAPIIKQMFERVAYKKYSGRDVYEWLKNETNLRSRYGNVLNLSVIYRMLNNPYYCGLFKYSGKWYKGTYEPIISKELFDAVQKKMTVAPKSKPGTKEFDFTRLFKCGNCGSGITAQEVFKRFKDGTSRYYTYYHCTQFYDYDCHEPYIREEKLIEQLAELLQQISVKIVETNPILKPELDKVMVIKRTLEKQNDNEQLKNQNELIQPDFIKYVFQEGTKEQKRELIGCINTTIFLRQKQIYIEKEMVQKTN
jgi:DNA invertase Pin-like site-specific DNA recombinase